MEKETRQNLVPPFRVLPAALFGLANALFLAKYSSRAMGLYGVPVAVYLFFVLVALLLLHGTLDRMGSHRTVFMALALSFAAGVLLIMAHVKASTLNVDRFSAITAFDSRLLAGQYPYDVRTHLGHAVSGFPGLFLLMLPFYLLGDPGYFQIPAFLLFCLLAWKTGLSGGKKTALLLLAASAPMFLWECTVRSELFGCMVLLIAALFWLEGKRGGTDLRTVAVAGALAGVFLSTRGIVMVPLMLFFTRFLKGRNTLSWVIFLVAAAVTVALFFLPFYFWDTEAFLRNNPFKVQSGYLPSGLLFTVLALTAVLSFSIRTWDGFCLTAGYVLFGTIALMLFLDVREMGFAGAVFGSGSDLSYFEFSTPFLLLSMFRPQGAGQPGGAPALSGTATPVRS